MESRIKLNAAAIDLVADALRHGDTIRIRAHGGSMLPTIWPGDILTIRPIMDHWPQVGEVALLQCESGLRAHRVVAHGTLDGFAAVVTHGDALESDDATVEASAILGTVIYRNGRPLEVSQSGWRRRVVGALIRSEPLQNFLLRVNALRNRYVWQPSRNQFA